jgi:hypothetical protein
VVEIPVRDKIFSFMRRLILLMILASVACSTAECWTPKTYQMVVVQSAKVMPLSFRNIMYQHKSEILSGALIPDQPGEPSHRYDVSSHSGYLYDRIAELVTLIPKRMNERANFAEVAFYFGSLSHYLADLNDPLLLMDNDSREPAYRADFAGYLERNIPLFPWVFSGPESDLLKKDQLQEYVFQTAQQATRNYAVIGDAYYPEGALVSSDTFDLKSLPFGVASLSYSRSIENTVQIWFYVWRKAHGDTKFTPFYNEKTTKRGTQ